MRISNLLIALTAACGLMALSAGGALSQDAPAVDQPAASDQAAPVRGPEDNWLKVCGALLPDGQRPCLMRQVIQSNGQFVGSFFLRDDPGQVDQLIVGAAVPLGVLLPAGVTWQIDNSQGIRTQYIYCDTSSCQTFQVLDENSSYLESLKKGNVLKLTAKNRQNEDVIVNINLAGFTAVYDGDRFVTFEELRDQTTGAGALERLLQDRAEKIRRENSGEDGATTTDGASPPAN